MYGNLFAAILGFCILRLLTKIQHRKSNMAFLELIIGGENNTTEVCIMTSAAVAAGSLTSGFMSAIPALGWFGYTYSPFILTLWVVSAGYFGMFFGVPLRKYALIIKNLRFPTGTATAVVIKNLCNTSKQTLAVTQGKVLVVMFIIGGIYTLLGAYFPVFSHIPIFSYLSFNGRITFFATLAFWRFSINISPAFIGTGMLVGMKVAISYTLGAITAWAILGPYIYSHQWVTYPFGYADPINAPSAQYWLLWVGTTMMIANSLTELILTLLRSFFPSCYLFSSPSPQIASPISDHDISNDKSDHNDDSKINISTIDVSSHDNDNEDDNNGDNKLENNEMDTLMLPLSSYLLQSIPRPWWITGLLLTTLFSLIVIPIGFEIVWYAVVIALILAFFLSFISIQATGETDINPITVVGKITQLLFAFVTPGNVVSNIMSANITTSAASQSVDLMVDLKTGFLLQIDPKLQFIAQIFGSSFGVIATILTYTLMTSAYPCINSVENIENCAFQVPGGAAWYGVAFAFNSPNILETFPHYCIEAMIISGLFGIISPFIERLLGKYSVYWLSVSGFALAFVAPQAYLSFDFLIGSLTFFVWKKLKPQRFEEFGMCVASGLSAGEGVTGVFIAFLALFGLFYQFCIGIPEDLTYICSSENN